MKLLLFLLATLIAISIWVATVAGGAPSCEPKLELVRAAGTLEFFPPRQGYYGPVERVVIGVRPGTDSACIVVKEVRK